MIHFVTIAATAVLTMSAATAAPLDPNNLRDPSALCRVLDRLDPKEFHFWDPSNSVSGGFMCKPLNIAREIGPEDRCTGYATAVKAYVYGGGRRKLDRVTLTLNVWNLATANDGKGLLLNAAGAMADHLGIPVPSGVEGAVNGQRAVMRDRVPTGPDRSLFREQAGPMIVEVTTGQAKITSISIHFRNPDASTLWN